MFSKEWIEVIKGNESNYPSVVGIWIKEKWRRRKWKGYRKRRKREKKKREKKEDDEDWCWKTMEVKDDGRRREEKALETRPAES